MVHKHREKRKIALSLYLYLLSQKALGPVFVLKLTYNIG